jgi:hypothetical protein
MVELISKPTYDVSFPTLNEAFFLPKELNVSSWGWQIISNYVVNSRLFSSWYCMKLLWISCRPTKISICFPVVRPAGALYDRPAQYSTEPETANGFTCTCSIHRYCATCGQNVLTLYKQQVKKTWTINGRKKWKDEHWGVNETFLVAYLCKNHTTRINSTKIR